MSHYADSVLAERPAFLEPVYYERPQTYNPVVSVAAPVALHLSRGPSVHANTIWPSFCEDPAPVVESVAFAGYDTAEPSAAPSTVYPSPWQNATLPSAAATLATSIPEYHRGFAGPSSPHRHSAGGAPSSAYQYHSRPQSPSPYESSYTFRVHRNTSPDSQLSVSEYTGWTSPKSTTDDGCSSVTSRNEGDDVCTPGGDSDVPRQSLPIHTSASSWAAPVKVEPEEPAGCFIMELPTGTSSTSNIPVEGNMFQAWQDQRVHIPAEVPLRATGASKRMRKMMNAFRVNPFSMHSLSVGSANGGLEGDDDDQSQATWCGGEARPLDEEPQMFEFQLELDGYPDREMECNDEEASRPRLFVRLDAIDETKPRSFSPDFELRPLCEGQDDASVPSIQQDQAGIFDSDQQGDPARRYHSHTSEYTKSQHGETGTLEDEDIVTQLEARLQKTQVQCEPPSGNFAVHDDHYGHPCRTSVSGWTTTGKIYSLSGYGPNSPPSPSGHTGAHFEYEGIKSPKLHSTSSHPYLRKSSQNQHTQTTPDPRAMGRGYTLAERFVHVGQATQGTPAQTYSRLQANQVQRAHHAGHFSDAYQSTEQTDPGSHQMTATQESHYGAGEGSQPSYMRIIRNSRDVGIEYAAPYRLPSAPNGGDSAHVAPCDMASVQDQIVTSLASQSAGGRIAPSSSDVGVLHRRWSVPGGDHGVPQYQVSAVAELVD